MAWPKFAAPKIASRRRSQHSGGSILACGQSPSIAYVCRSKGPALTNNCGILRGCWCLAAKGIFLPRSRFWDCIGINRLRYPVSRHDPLEAQDFLGDSGVVLRGGR